MASNAQYTENCLQPGCQSKVQSVEARLIATQDICVFSDEAECFLYDQSHSLSSADSQEVHHSVSYSNAINLFGLRILFLQYNTSIFDLPSFFKDYHYIDVYISYLIYPISQVKFYMFPFVPS